MIVDWPIPTVGGSADASRTFPYTLSGECLRKFRNCQYGHTTRSLAYCGRIHETGDLVDGAFPRETVGR